MTTSDPRRTFLESLLRDDPAESHDQFQEYRIMLENKLQKAERSFRTRRRFTIGLWVGIASLVLLGASSWRPSAVPRCGRSASPS